MTTVFITGGTGFIGSHIVEEFCRQGIEVACLVRPTSNLDYLEELPVNLVEGDVRNYSSIRKAVAGCDWIIHNAAYAADWGSYDQFYATNVEGTLNLLRAGVENNIKNIILTSSISVYGEEDSDQIKDESCAYNAHYDYFLDNLVPCKMNYYRDTKAQAEKEAIDYAQKQELNLTVLQPVWVYGEREFNTGFFEYLQTVKTGIPGLPGSKQNKFHVIYVRDLARAYYLTFKKELTGINSFIIGNQEAELMERIYTLFVEQAGLRKPCNLPKWLVYPLGFSLELIYTILNSKHPPILTRGRVNMFYDNLEFSTAKAQEVLGFKQQYSLKEGIKNTVDWYQEHGFL